MTVQREIAKKFPLLAYVPRKLPAGYRYAKYFSPAPGDLVLQLHKTGAPFWDTIAFEVGRRVHGVCGLRGTKLSVNGVVVDWSGTDTLEQAARCIARDGRSLLVAASRSEPIRSADFLKLARMVVQIKHFH